MYLIQGAHRYVGKLSVGVANEVDVIGDRTGVNALEQCKRYKALPNDETKLRALVTELKAYGQLLFVVDQPATIGALPLAVARDEGVLVAYLPGLAMRRIADLHAG